MNKKFFDKTTITVTSYSTPIDIGFNAKKITIKNENTSEGILKYSFDGSTDDGSLDAGEPFTEQGGKFLVRRIWFKKENAGETVRYRLWARDQV